MKKISQENFRIKDMRTVFEKFGFKKSEIEFLLHTIPLLKFSSATEIEETLITLESLCFKNFQETILSTPNILLLPSYEIGEDVHKLLWKYKEMEHVRKKFLEKRG